MENTFNRKQITNEALDFSLAEIKNQTLYRLRQKGWGTFASSHEILGVITEEYDELKNAIKSNNMEEIEHEILDIAVACHIAIACINEKTLDW